MWVEGLPESLSPHNYLRICGLRFESSKGRTTDTKICKRLTKWREAVLLVKKMKIVERNECEFRSYLLDNFFFGKCPSKKPVLQIVVTGDFFQIVVVDDFCQMLQIVLPDNF